MLQTITSNLNKQTMFAGKLYYLWVMMIVYAVHYLTFYPCLYTSVDEASTFRMAYVLRHGWVVPHDPGFFPSISPIGPHGPVYRFPIGFPAVLALFSGFGWRALFLVNPLLHLAATWCFAGILRHSRIPPAYAVLYLFYPSLVLFTRTLFSDPFAASLTTIGLFFLLRRQTTVWGGVCLGLALTARSSSLLVALLLAVALLVWDLRRHTLLRREGQFLPFVLGLLPFVAINLLYNNAALGGPFRSTYSLRELSLGNVEKNGPLYAASLLGIYPGMLLAPLLYRGWYWKVGLVAAFSGLLLASAFEETTYGNNILQTLLSAPRQILPVIPLFLLAYCSVLARWMPEIRLRRFPVFPVVAILLGALAAGVSFMHQKYLKRLVAIQSDVAQALPPQSIVYANKDAYKLHQPQWDTRTYRELPYVTEKVAAADLRTRPVYVVLFVRSRGFSDEDFATTQIMGDMKTRFLLTPGPTLSDAQLQCWRLAGLRTGGGT